MMKHQLTILCLFGLFLVQNSFGAIGNCQTIKLNETYHCPSQDLPADSEFLYVEVSTQYQSLSAGKLRDGVLTNYPMFREPAGWRMSQHSISPDRKIVLVTMIRPDCPANWPNTSGESCSWGRGVLWAGFLRQNSFLGKYYRLINLASYYGRNSHIVGWHSWLTTKKVLFNAKISPDGVSIGTDSERMSGFAYTIDFEHNDSQITAVSSASLWGGSVVNDEQCLVVRMHASMPSAGFSDTCSAGQYVVFGRRCSDEPMGPQDFSWYNTVNINGSGGTCSPPGGSVETSRLVPVLKNYVVEVDSQCNPVAFDRNEPIRSPDYTGRYRHMGYTAEWGDGQATMSIDGKIVAFWSKKSSSLARSTNNCAGFDSENGTDIGNGADRVRLCLLDSNKKCGAVFDLPEPANAWNRQGWPYFYTKNDGHLALFTTENDGGYLTDLVTGQRTRVLNGGGGYPIVPFR